jgi:hypothetical protein
MKTAYVKLKNGYSTIFPSEFMTEDEERGCLVFFGEKGRVAMFLLDQVDMCVITDRRSEEE